MKKLKLGLVQAKIFYDPKKSLEENDSFNYGHTLKLLKKFKKNEVDLVVFPEYYPGNATFQIKDLKELHDEAKRINAYIIGGEAQKVGKKWYNSETLISPKGEIAGRYHKIKLYEDEKKFGCCPGKQVKTFKIKGVNVGILTCYDMHFSSLIEKLKDDGADVIVNTSQIVPAYSDFWKSDLVFNSNLFDIPIAAVNCCLYKTDHNVYYGGGKSKIILPSKVDFNKMANPINIDDYITKELGTGEGILKYTIKVK